MSITRNDIKILFLNQTGELGGGELTLLGIVTNLAYPVTVLLFEDGPLRGQLEAAAIAVAILPSGPAALAIRRQSGIAAALRAAPAVLGMVRQVAAHMRRYNITVANSQKAFVVGALAARLSGSKLVWQLQDLLSAAHFSKPLRRLVIFLANHYAAAVITNSNASKAAFIAQGGKASLVTVIHPGVDAAAFDAVTQPQANALRATITTSELPLIGMFGRLAAWKGQMVFIEALALTPGCTGAIIGGPLFGEEAFEQALRARIAELGLQNRIHLLGFRDDIPALMKAMDIIVHASTAPEPFGRVIVEAMLAAKPIIAARDGGVMEIIEPGITGWLTPPGNPAALAATLQSAINTPEQTTQIATAGQAHARKVFTLQATATKFASVISRLT